MSYFKSEKAISNLVKTLHEEYVNAEKSNDIHSNVIDPFSSLLEASFNDTNYDEWLEGEKTRQIQKTLQNLIGTLHERIIGELKGCENLTVGNVIDIVSEEKKIIAEIKNKFNTTKGNHKVAIYDDIASVIGSTYSEFCGYYVEIIPKNPTPYNDPFRPSDNTIKGKGVDKKRPLNDKIRIIDGKSFYALLTKDENAIYKIYDEIVQALMEIGLTVNQDFKQLLIKAYGKPIED